MVRSRNIIISVSIATILVVGFVNCGKGFQANNTVSLSSDSGIPVAPSDNLEWVITPTAFDVPEGTQVEFTSLAKSDAPISYQWSKTISGVSANIVGATSASYSFVVPKGNINYRATFCVIAESNSKQIKACSNLTIKN